MTGAVVIDYKGDRIMDYLVWYLASDSDKFDGYMKIPLTYAGRNTTACVEWLVINAPAYRPLSAFKSYIITDVPRHDLSLAVGLQDGPKKQGHRLMTIILSNVNRFKNNQIKKRFTAESVSEKSLKSVNIWQSYK